jgi:hypothetical protein
MRKKADEKSGVHHSEAGSWWGTVTVSRRKDDDLHMFFAFYTKRRTSGILKFPIPSLSSTFRSCKVCSIVKIRNLHAAICTMASASEFHCSDASMPAEIDETEARENYSTNQESQIFKILYSDNLLSVKSCR